MSMMQTTDVAADAQRLRTALERAYPKIDPRQAQGVNVHTSVKRLDHDAAVGHAKWTIRSIEQDVTDKCLTTAACSLLWLQEFIEVNGLNIEQQSQTATLRPGVTSGIDAISAH